MRICSIASQACVDSIYLHLNFQIDKQNNFIHPSMFTHGLQYTEGVRRSFQWHNRVYMQTAITASKCSVHPSGIKFEAKFRDTQWTDITLVVQLGNDIVIIPL